jgi:hypothetical protein
MQLRESRSWNEIHDDKARVLVAALYLHHLLPKLMTMAVNILARMMVQVVGLPILFETRSRTGRFGRLLCHLFLYTMN